VVVRWVEGMVVAEQVGCCCFEWHGIRVEWRSSRGRRGEVAERVCVLVVGGWCVGVGGRWCQPLFRGENLRGGFPPLDDEKFDGPIHQQKWRKH
jgi:hypothetical protein